MTDAGTRLAVVLGHPVAHSKSPAMFSAAFAAAKIDASYLAWDVAPPRLAQAVDDEMRKNERTITSQ